MFRDQESNAHVEYGIIFALIALFVGVWGYAVTRNGHAAFSAAVVPAGASVTPDGRGSDHPFAERHYHIRDLSDIWPGLESAFGEQHYRIADLAILWAIGAKPCASCPSYLTSV